MAIIVAFFAGSAGQLAIAQDLEQPDQADANTEVSLRNLTAPKPEVEEIEVTGSRLKRTTFSSIAPLQVISGQISREAGLMNVGDILQSSTASGGQQVDLTFGGYVLDNGPGSVTIDLRGLGESRTLLLLNGRRLAPAGVEGAPSSPDLGLLPTSLVSQYDLLLDGASSVYGSDAIAGVVNVVLRKDFDGLEVELFSTKPQHGSGEENTFNFAWGKNYDRGFIGLGGEYQKDERVLLENRPWTRGCERHHEIDANGNIRSEDLFNTTVLGMRGDGCALRSLVGRVIVPEAGSIYYTPGYTNGGWANFSESSIANAFGVDGDGDGQTDINFRDYDLNGRDQRTMLSPPVKRHSLMAYGEYTLDGEANITPYFEALYARRKVSIYSGQTQLFPDVPGLNPFNICNPEAEGGTDCGDAYDALINNPNVVAAFEQNFGCDPREGDCKQTVGALGAAPVIPIVSVRGDRTHTDVDVSQFRFLGGAKADLPFINFASLQGWSVDTSFIYSQSTGTSAREGIREDRINLALGNLSSTNTPCMNDTGTVLAADAAPGCVPVNMLAPSLYRNSVGDFATAAERRYLFDNRDFDTNYTQTIFSTYATGDLLELPGGTAVLGLGLEWREDTIDSQPDQVAEQGLLIGFFSDGGAVGEKTTEEVFAEIELPLVAGQPFVTELTLNLSGRWTNDEIYGSDTTSSLKIGYRPIDSLLIRATRGTSFRAPNLREVFLRSQSGFGNVLDPCLIPEAAIDELSDGYIPANETREQQVLDNCRANGVDPTLASNGGVNVSSVEVAAGGSTELLAETSTASSAGFSWDQPFTNAFDLSLGATYYEIEVNNTIIEPSAQFVVNDCYGSAAGNSVFCDRISRNTSDPAAPLLSYIDNGFINRDEEKVRGVDINMEFNNTLTVSQRPVELSLITNVNNIKSRSTRFEGENGEVDEQEYAGEWGFPHWRLTSTLRAELANWSFTWRARYMSSVEQDPEDIDDFADAINGASDTCLGPPDDVLCRDFAEAGSYWVHNLSAYYESPRGWNIGVGLRNLFDQQPPEVDGSEVAAINNTPIGYGYDLEGRTYFLNLGYAFGGGE